MKKLFTTSILIFCFCFCKAQYATIPDANFVSWLGANGYSSALSGNQLDTTNTLVTSATTMDCSGMSIADLTGIGYFKNLTSLNCGSNNLTTIPPLPPNLTYLSCSYNNNLASLPPLPQSLVYLDAGYDNIANVDSFPPNLINIQIPVNALTTLPGLPQSLLYLNCEGCMITNLPSLPPSLITLNVDGNYLQAMPDLPSALDTLLCNSGFMASLPDLPGSLEWLDCDYCKNLTSLPDLPGTLTFLNCNNCPGLTGLPALPSSLTYLSSSNGDWSFYKNCTNCGLTSLPALPANLIHMDCSLNELTSIPALPNSLVYVDVSSNQLTSLPALPASVDTIICLENQLTSLPALPSGLKYLECASNAISTLPSLPNRLYVLDCSNNIISALPFLPQSLNSFYCAHNFITNIPDIPAGLYDFDCGNNLLTDLPDIPNRLEVFRVDSNPGLLCMPFMYEFYGPDYTFSVAGSGITCLPNVILHAGSIPAIDTMPVCGLFNPAGCALGWNIKGQVVKDADGDCATTNDGTPLQNVSMKLYNNTGGLLQQLYINTNGNYSFNTGLGTFTVKADTAGLPFNILCPTGATHSDTLTVSDSLDYNGSFRFACKNGFDLGINAIAPDEDFFPNATVYVSLFAGDEASYYGVACNTGGVGGTVTATVSGPVTISSATSSGIASSVVNGNTVTWSVPDFSQVDFKKSFGVTLHTNISAQAGNQVCVTASINASGGTDYNPANNNLSQCFTTTNSHDPNSKEVSPDSALAPGYAGYLTYTIHFQNTGTAAARNIQILDTISHNLDISTFQLVGFSQACVTQVLAASRVVKFGFPNINLPDSTTDKTNSMGYVQYKIKPVANLAANNSISNTAYIYFDFNSPVVTNTVTNSVQLATAVKNVNEMGEVNIYPNPTSEQLTVSSNQFAVSNVEIVDVLGRTLITQQATNRQTIINVSHLSAGVYFVRVQSGGVEVVKKFVKE